MTNAADLSPARRMGALAFLLTGYFFYAWSWNTVDILRPYIQADLGLSLTQSGSLYTVQAIGAIVGAVVMGQVADKIGRRNALIISMVGYGGMLLSALLVHDYAALIGQRVLMGFFLGSMYPIAVGIYSGLFARSMRGLIAGFVLGTYNLAVSALGFLSAAAFRAGLDWRLLLWAGLIPVVLAGFALVVVPDDRKITPFDAEPGGPTTAQAAVPIAELFQAGVARQTILLALMSGLNFFAYQAFTGWASTYLRTERGIPDTVVGDVLGWQFIGAAAGGLAWGWVSDRLGRKSGATGFILAAAIVPIYLFAPLPVPVLEATGFVYGVMLSASAIWGPWLSELYPPHLRSTAASIYNWGRVISMTAPLITAPMAEALGLAPVMCLASVSFLLAAVIWFRLPETVNRSRA
ncbi:MAG: MFS transporter [Phenylobacterium sp.]